MSNEIIFHHYPTDAPFSCESKIRLISSALVRDETAIFPLRRNKVSSGRIVMENDLVAHRVSSNSLEKRILIPGLRAGARATRIFRARLADACASIVRARWPSRGLNQR